MGWRPCPLGGPGQASHWGRDFHLRPREELGRGLTKKQRVRGAPLGDRGPLGPLEIWSLLDTVSCWVFFGVSEPASLLCGAPLFLCIGLPRPIPALGCPACVPHHLSSVPTLPSHWVFLSVLWASATICIDSCCNPCVRCLLI